MTDLQDVPSHPRRTVLSPVAKHFNFWEIGARKRVSDRHDGGAGRTVTGVTGRHRSPGNWRVATATVTDRRRHDGPSQAAQSQAVWDFSTRFKGRF